MVSDFDTALFSPAFLQDPYPTLAGLQAEAPVYWSPGLNAWVLSSFRDVNSALRDYTRFSNRGMMSRLVTLLPEELRARAERLAGLVDGNMVMMQDPPQHTRLRRVVGSFFLPSRIEKLRGTVEGVVTELLEQQAGAGSMDCVVEFAEPLSRTILAEFLGVGRHLANQFGDWGQAVIAFVVSPQAGERTVDDAVAAFDGISEFIGSEVKRRKASTELADDVLGVLIAAEESEGFNQEEIAMTCVQLIFAGAHTTASLIASGMLLLLRHEDQLALLKETPTLVPAVVEEALRVESPGRFDVRITTQDVDVAGVTIPGGSTVLMSLAGANRDPDEFRDPDRFDITRPGNHHLAFSVGPHFCVGASLARLQSEIALARLVQRFPALKLSGQAQWRASFAGRELEALPVSW